ncbi:hypothetical protein [Roseateles sp.]|uniref:hypothetical protein n=1 Tax=Roseateles sp. TaxID=1971397 RepID=UPI0031E3EEFD
MDEVISPAISRPARPQFAEERRAARAARAAGSPEVLQLLRDALGTAQVASEACHAILTILDDRVDPQEFGLIEAMRSCLLRIDQAAEGALKSMEKAGPAYDG